MPASVDLRHIPSVDALLRQPEIAALSGPLPREVVARMVREELAEQRQRLRECNGAVVGPGVGIPQTSRTAAGDVGEIVAGILRRATAFGVPNLRRVINATGVVLHTNLGRAPLSASAARAMLDIATGYANLEYDLAAGVRGSRHTHLEEAICTVTGAEAALAVDNTTAAVLLVLAEVAAGREVIVSRGQAIEIGGGFRIPDVMRQSGARLVEVGTTNRTRLSNYAAIGPQTGALLYVHTSNFRVVGFSEAVSPDALASLGRERGIPTIGDQGSGCLLPTERFGIAGKLREPMVQEYVGAGMDAVCFSGDKLLGGPQAGIIAGRADLIARLKGHPLTRALRLDKIAIAELAATLRHYQAQEAEREVPVWRMIALTSEALRATAERWAATLQQGGPDVHVMSAASAIGGGSLPGVTLPTHVVAVRPSGAVDGAAAALRQGVPPIVGRIADDQLLFDPRTVLPEDEVALLSALAAF